MSKLLPGTRPFDPGIISIPNCGPDFKEIICFLLITHARGANGYVL